MLHYETSALYFINLTPHYQLLRLHFFPVLQRDEIRPTRIIHRRDGQIADGDTPQYLTVYHLPGCRFDFYGRWLILFLNHPPIPKQTNGGAGVGF